MAAAYDVERHRQFVVDVVEGGRCSKMGCHNDIGLEVRHLVHHGSARTPPTWRATVDEIRSAVHRGGARGGRLSVDGACNQEPDGDTRRRDSDLDRFGPSIDVIPYVLCLWCIVLRCIQINLSSRGPLSLLIYSEKTRLQVKYPIWYYYNI